MNVKDLRQKNSKEISKIIDDLKAELFMLRFKNSTGQLDQPHKINLVRKDIARVFTVINEKNNNKIISKPKKVEVKMKNQKIKKSKISNEKNFNSKTNETKIKSSKTPKKEIKKEKKGDK